MTSEVTTTKISVNLSKFLFYFIHIGRKDSINSLDDNDSVNFKADKKAKKAEKKAKKKEEKAARKAEKKAEKKAKKKAKTDEIE